MAEQPLPPDHRRPNSPFAWRDCVTCATDVSSDVGQPTLILATRNDGAVSFDHAEYLAATLPGATLVEVDTPTHLLWLGLWLGSHGCSNQVFHHDLKHSTVEEL